MSEHGVDREGEWPNPTRYSVRAARERPVTLAKSDPFVEGRLMFVMASINAARQHLAVFGPDEEHEEREKHPDMTGRS